MSFEFRVPRCARFFLETHFGNSGQPTCSNQVSEFRVSKTVSFFTDALKTIVLNIINNAIDAINKDGVVTIMTHLVAGEVRVVIQDNGNGIASDILPHIFEPFFTTKDTGKGTGLGLSITYGLVKKLGGDITVRSHIGQGTAFTITLPIHSEKHDAN